MKTTRKNLVFIRGWERPPSNEHLVTAMRREGDIINLFDNKATGNYEVEEGHSWLADGTAYGQLSTLVELTVDFSISGYFKLNDMSTRNNIIGGSSTFEGFLRVEVDGSQQMYFSGSQRIFNSVTVLIDTVYYFQLVRVGILFELFLNEISSGTATVSPEPGEYFTIRYIGSWGSSSEKLKGNAWDFDISSDGIPVFSNFLAQDSTDMKMLSEVGPDVQFVNGTYPIIEKSIEHGHEWENYSEVENLLKWSEDLTNVVWNKGGSSVTKDTQVAPDESLTAGTLIQDTSDGLHSLQYSVGNTLIPGDLYTAQVYLKEVGTQFVNVRFGRGSDYSIFDLVNGSVSNTGAATSEMEDVGNGWFRCQITSPVQGNGSEYNYVTIRLYQDEETSNYVGDGTSGVKIWHNQLNKGASYKGYIETSNSAANGKIPEDPTNKGFDVRSNPLTNPGTPQKNLKVTGFTCAWDNNTYAQTTADHESYYDFEIKFRVTNIVSITTLLGANIAGYFSIRLPAGGTGVISIVRGGQAVIWSSDVGKIITDTDHTIRIYGNSSILTVILDGITLADSEAIIGGFQTGYPIAIGTNLVVGQFWEGSIEYVKRRNISDDVINHWVCESSPTSLQASIYDIGPSGNHAVLVGATLPFFTTEKEEDKLFVDGFAKDAVFGGEKVTNGGFDTGFSGWNKNLPWVWDNGVMSIDGTQTSSKFVTQLGVLESSTYLMSFDVLNHTAGGVRLVAQGGAAWDTGYVYADGHYEFSIDATSDAIGDILIGSDVDFNGSVDNISVKQIAIGLVPARADGVSALNQLLTHPPGTLSGDHILLSAPLSRSFYDMAVLTGIEDDLYLAGDAIGITPDAWALLSTNPIFFSESKNQILGYTDIQSGTALDKINQYIG